MRVRIEPRLLREAVRMHYSTQLSTREIASSIGLSRNSLKRLRRHLESIECDVAQLANWSDEQLYQRLGITPFNGFRLKAIPDWNGVGQNHQRGGSQSLEWVGQNLQRGWVRITGTRCQNHQRLQLLV